MHYNKLDIPGHIVVFRIFVDKVEGKTMGIVANWIMAFQGQHLQQIWELVKTSNQWGGNMYVISLPQFYLISNKVQASFTLSRAFFSPFIIFLTPQIISHPFNFRSPLVRELAAFISSRTSARKLVLFGASLPPVC